MQKLVPAIMLLALIAVMAPASDEIDFETLFSYFPDNAYNEFGYFNLAAARKTEVFPIMEKLRRVSGDSLIGSLPPLPESFMDQIEVVISGKIRNADTVARQEAMREEMQETMGDAESRSELTDKQKERLEAAAGKLREFSRRGRMFVAIIPGVQGLIGEALENGTFAETGKHIGERAIYNVRSRSETGSDSRSHENFAFVSDAGDLLLSADMATLREMIECSRGMVPSLLDNQDYIAVFARVNREHQGWFANPDHAAKKVLITQMYNTGAPEEKIIALEEQTRKGEVMNIQSVHLTDRLVVRRTAEYLTEEAAEQAYVQQSQQFSQAGESMKEARKSVKEQEDEMSAQERRLARTAMGFAGNLLNSNKITQDGKLVITDIIFGKKQLGTLNMLLGFAEKMEEQERQKQAAEESQQN